MFFTFSSFSMSSSSSSSSPSTPLSSLSSSSESGYSFDPELVLLLLSLVELLFALNSLPLESLEVKGPPRPLIFLTRARFASLDLFSLPLELANLPNPPRPLSISLREPKAFSIGKSSYREASCSRSSFYTILTSYFRLNSLLLTVENFKSYLNLMKLSSIGSKFSINT
jgi:hypothetical protein